MISQEMAMPQEPVIQTDNLTKTYGAVTAVDQLSLTVPEHAIFGFLGPNGAGKTTTMKLLLGLIRPTAGQGEIFGHDIVAESLAIRRRIGYLPQQPRFYETMTARQTLHFAASFFFRGPQRQIAERVEEMLELVGLAGKGDRAVKGFSGGERQRLGIAQAQINYPDLLILDEPAAALDPIGRRDVLNIMERLRQYTTVFYSTHILDDVQQVSDTVAILNQGRLVTQGPIETLLHGDGEIVYGVAMKGDAARAYQRVQERPWVSEIHVLSQNGAAEEGVVQWQVGVTDAEAAERDLLRVLLRDENLRVTAFGRRQYELEDVFMQLINGGDNGS
jgi:ABC-2 type transport system ATP-binding protein